MAITTNRDGERRMAGAPAGGGRENARQSLGSNAGPSGKGTAGGDPRAQDVALQRMNNVPTAGTTAAKPAPAGPPGGGSATTNTYEPGAVPNYPDADLATVVDVLASALPGGLANAAPGILASIEDPSKPHPGALGQMLGANPGPQKGFARDRSRGAGSFSPNDPRGDSPDERAIAGSRIGAGTEALTGDDSGDTVDENTGPFSDVTLQDRRKPRMGAGTQMLLGM
jgi:hypothetical protein